jgi:hypothetical protein
MEGSWLQKLWSPWSRGALGTWICSLTQKLSEPIAQGFYGGFIMETWSTINSVSCPSTVSGDCGIWMEAPTSNPALVFLVTSPHPGVTSLRQETLLSHRKFQGIQVLCVRTSSCPGNCKGLRSSVSGTRVKDQKWEPKILPVPLPRRSSVLGTWGTDQRTLLWLRKWKDFGALCQELMTDTSIYIFSYFMADVIS